MVCLTLFIFYAISSLFPFNQVLTSISGAIFITVAMVYAPALFDPQKRTLYDRFCNTRVIAG
jgi:hypothetical protein